MKRTSRREFLKVSGTAMTGGFIGPQIVAGMTLGVEMQRHRHQAMGHR